MCVCACVGVGAPYCACAYFYRIAASEAKKEKEIVAVTDFGTISAGSFSIAYGNESGMLRRAHRPSKRKALASVNRSGLPIPEKERPCTAPKESLA